MVSSITPFLHPADIATGADTIQTLYDALAEYDLAHRNAQDAAAAYEVVKIEIDDLKELYGGLAAKNEALRNTDQRIAFVRDKLLHSHTHIMEQFITATTTKRDTAAECERAERKVKVLQSIPAAQASQMILDAARLNLTNRTGSNSYTPADEIPF